MTRQSSTQVREDGTAALHLGITSACGVASSTQQSRHPQGDNVVCCSEGPHREVPWLSWLRSKGWAGLYKTVLISFSNLIHKETEASQRKGPQDHTGGKRQSQMNPGNYHAFALCYSGAGRPCNRAAEQLAESA